MTTRTNLVQSLAALVASDQSYASKSLQVGTPLAAHPDLPVDVTPDYQNPLIYKTAPAFNVPTGYVVDKVIDRSEIGAKVVIYKNLGTGEVMVAFGGTDGPDAQDWVTNTQSFGWSQWEALKDPNRGNLFAELDASGSTSIHFVGQSLGGALAQYAAVEYVQSKIKPTETNPNPTFDKSTVSLTTFNGLGAKSGLNAHLSDYDDSILAGIGQVAHYVVDNDIVSRIGGGHVGADGEIIKLDWTYLDGRSVGKPMDVTDAHRIETAFYTHLGSLGLELTGGSVVVEGGINFSLINAPNAVYWAAKFGDLGNNSDVTSLEAPYRLISGLVGGGMAAPVSEIDEVIQAYLKAQYRAGKLADNEAINATNYQWASQLNWGNIARQAAISPFGVSVYGFSTLGAIWIDFTNSIPGNKVVPATEFALELVKSNLWKELVSLNHELQTALETGANQVAILVANATTAWESLITSLDQAGSEAADHFLKFALGLSQDLSNIPDVVVRKYQDAMATIGSLSQTLEEAGASAAKQFLKFALGLSRWLDESGQVVSNVLSIPLSVVSNAWKSVSIGSAWASVFTFTSAEMYSAPLHIALSVRDSFVSATTVTPARRDPLILDLNANGLETVGINTANPILFDHDADGIKTATGWIGANDAFLVLDRNGNSTIDNGTELFGDATPLYAGPSTASGQAVAVDGFAALAQEDSNLDGKVDSLDARFADLRLWRDLNQDGLSQADELFTLASQGVVALTVAKTENAVVLANGNQIADLGGFIRSDGSGGTLAAVNQLADVDLASNPFYSQFTDVITLTPEAASLPEMNGSGQVRSLRQAASLATVAGGTLAAQLATFAADTTRNGQRARIDNLLKSWTNTSTMATTATGAFAGVNLTLSFAGITSGTPAYQAWLDKLSILERFNGQTFLPVPAAGSTLSINFFAERMALLDRAYGALKDSVYGALVMQTRLKPYLDDINLKVGAAGVTLDYGAMMARLDALKMVDPASAMGDLVDLQRFAGKQLTGWDGLAQIAAELRSPATAGVIRTVLANDGLVHAGSWSGSGDGEFSFGGTGDDSMYANDGDDLVNGDSGNDWISGGAGNDTLDGGIGNDHLDGGLGNDRFVFTRGGGHDTVDVNDATIGKLDTLQLSGLTPTDVAMHKWGDSLVFILRNTGPVWDWIQFTGFFGGASRQIDQVVFGDGSVWSKAQMLAQPVEVWGDASGNVISGRDGGPNLMWGEDGNDDIYGGDGNDQLRGGNGNDLLMGRSGNDVLRGDAGNDNLLGDSGNDTLDGGVGNDHLDGGLGNDTFVFALGGGHDTVDVNDLSLGKVDTLNLVGLTAADIAMQKWGDSLAFVIRSTGPTWDWIQFTGFFRGASNQIDQVVFGDGSIWSKAQMLAQPVELWGDALGNVMSGRDGGPNLMWGEDGNDDLYGGDGHDQIRGGNGNDLLVGRAGNDVLLGDTGNDNVLGDAGNDTLDGGVGNDHLDGGLGNDIFVFTRGGGHDTVDVNDATAGKLDTLSLTGLSVLEVGLQKWGQSLVFVVKNTGPTWDWIHFTNFFNGASNQIDEVVFADGTVWSKGQLLSQTIEVFGDANGNVLEGRNGGPNLMRGEDGNDDIYGGDGFDQIYGGNGNDLVAGRAGDDVLRGDAGNDNVLGDAGNDILDGGSGNDHLDGGLGNDTFVFALGGGHDTVDVNDLSLGKVDTLNLVGLTAADIAMQKWGDSLAFVIRSTGPTWDWIQFSGFFSGASRQIDQVVFGDGSIWSKAQMLAQPVELWGDALGNVMSGRDGGPNLMWGEDGNDDLYGGDGHDQIRGGNGNDLLMGRAGSDVLLGEAGNDNLLGDAGNDTLDGGSGNDHLDGGLGNDTFVFTRGGGHDTVDVNDATVGKVDTLQLTGLAPADVAIHMWRDSLVVILRNTGPTWDRIEFTGFFSSPSRQIDQVAFGDGSVWSKAQLLAQPIEVWGDAFGNVISGRDGGPNLMWGEDGNDDVYGGNGHDQMFGGNGNDLLLGRAGNDVLRGDAGNDSIIGDAGNDTLNGGSGDDRLDGGAGNDTYVFSRGGGHDILVVNDATVGKLDTLRLAGLSVTDVDLQKWTNSLAFVVKNTGPVWDWIYVENFFLGASNSIERVEFDDGTVWTTAQLIAQPVYMWGDTTDNTFTGHDGGGNRMFGLDGNDWLYGGNSGDEIEGGNGNDYTDGRAGADTASYASATAAVTVNLGITSAQNTIGAGIDTLVSIENLSGSNFNDTLIGDAGNNILEGRGGNDILNGGLGTDAASYASSASAVTVSLALASAQSTLGAGDDSLVSIENLIGSSYNDTLVGNSGANVLDGGAGIDMASYVAATFAVSVTLATNAAQNTVGGGTDTLLNIEGVIGSAFDDSLSGGAADDMLEGGAGNDVLDGGAGSDTASYASATTAVTVSLVAIGAQATLGAGTDTLISIESLRGSAFNDTLTGDAGDNVIEGGAGNDLLNGGLGIDTASYANATAGVVASLATTAAQNTVAAGIDTLLGIENLTGSGFNDTLTGSLGSNVLDGGGGIDTVSYANAVTAVSVSLAIAGLQNTGGGGSDALLNVENLLGSNYNDSLIGSAAGNVLEGRGGNDSIDGGLGSDTASYASASAAVVVSLATTAAQNTVAAGIDTLLNIENLSGGAYNDTLTGNDGNNSLAGGAGADTLAGGLGIDTLIGGAGNDTYLLDDAVDVVVETDAASAGGIDLVRASVTATLGANVENLQLVGTTAINGVGNVLANVLTGNLASNSLDGAAGNDTLDGGAGADTLFGGDGNDTYIVDDLGDVINEVNALAAGGIDVVRASVSSTLGANVENLVLTGALAINGVGNALANALTGNAAVNSLDGGAGNDSLDGGLGADTLVGGDGNDTYVIESADDLVIETNAVLALGGTDTVRASLTTTLGGNLENLVLTGASAIDGFGNALANSLTGNAASNLLEGGAGNDVLDGGLGIDTLIGGDGNDAYVVDNAGDVIVETNATTAGGIDLVRAAFSVTLGANLENLLLTGTAQINGSGNALANVLTGNSATNVLGGGDGNDTLDGGLGADTLLGGFGNDIYVIESAGDRVDENDPLVSGGIDLVRSTITTSLGFNIENLQLSGSALINGTGNELGNSLTGNAGVNILEGLGGDDWLDGSLGADTLRGGEGNDTYVIDNAGDVVVEADVSGIDLLRSTVSTSLSSNLENLLLTGSTAITGGGNSLDNVLTGNSAINTLNGFAGSDTLNGGAGADTLIGGSGDDLYVVDNALDVVSEFAGEGIDLVQSSVTFTLAAEVESLSLIGASSINGTGNALSNVLLGNSGGNVLTGNAGDDTLDGGAGADRMLGGSGNDLYRFGPGSGADIINDTDATLANTDQILLGAGISLDQLWFRHVGNNLEVSVIGTSDKMTVENWYLGSANHIEQFRTSDNHRLLDTQVENLVQAMAGFAPPTAGQTSLPPAYQTALAPVLAANWQ